MFTFNLPIDLRGPRVLGHPLVNAFRYMAAPERRAFELEFDFGGNVMPVADRQATLVVVRGEQALRHLFTNPVWTRPSGGLIVPPADRPELGALFDSMIMMNGERHKARRRLMLAPTHARDSLAWMAPTMYQNAATTAEALRWDEEFDVYKFVADLALRNNLKCLLANDSPRALAMASLAHTATNSLLSPAMVVGQAVSRAVGRPVLAYGEWVDAMTELHRTLLALAREGRERAEEGRDVVATLARARDESGQGLTDEELAAEILGLYGAGYETTAVALSWALFLLAAHPHVQQSLGEELGTDAGSPVSLNDPEHYPQLDRVVNETLRLLAPTTLSIPRVASEATILGGVALPRGTVAVMAPVLTHRESWCGAEPNRFRPTRWTVLKPSQLTYQYMPFGAGPRRCIGDAVAALQIRVVLAALLRRYRFEVPSEGITVDVKTRQIVGYPQGVKLVTRPHTDPLQHGGRVRGNVTNLVTLPR